VIAAMFSRAKSCQKPILPLRCPDGDSLEIRPYDLPADCAAKCPYVAEAMGFLIAGVDLRNENGIWYCFEVNPRPDSCTTRSRRAAYR